MNDLPGIDLGTSIVRLGGDRRMFAFLLGNFELSERSTVADIRCLLLQGATSEAAKRLHRLRGVAANLGAVDVACLASEAERAIKLGQEDAVPRILTGLDNAMAVVFETVRALAAERSPVPRSMATTMAPGALQDGLAGLLVLLRNSDLKALNEFLAFRAAIESAAGHNAAQQLADAIDALAFPAAEKLILAIAGKLDCGGKHEGE
jgi:two-component system sensor histidine kinase/response regulator